MHNDDRIQPIRQIHAIGSIKVNRLCFSVAAKRITSISVSMGIRTQSSATGGYRLMDKTIKGGDVVTISAPYKGGWVAAIVKE